LHSYLGHNQGRDYAGDEVDAVVVEKSDAADVFDTATGHLDDGLRLSVDPGILKNGTFYYCVYKIDGVTILSK
jgi:hypothetical protein